MSFTTTCAQISPGQQRSSSCYLTFDPDCSQGALLPWWSHVLNCLYAATLSLPSDSVSSLAFPSIAAFKDPGPTVHGYVFIWVSGSDERFGEECRTRGSVCASRASCQELDGPLRRLRPPAESGTQFMTPRGRDPLS